VGDPLEKEVCKSSEGLTRESHPLSKEVPNSSIPGRKFIIVSEAKEIFDR
jgi:hypothetical protein